MVDTNAQIFGNSDVLVNAMGRWPSFHDARVIDFIRTGDTYEALIHVFQMTKDLDPQGYYVLQNHHLVTLQMAGVAHSTLPEEYKADTLLDLSGERAGGLLKVVFDSVTDQSGYVLCREVNVIKVTPCGPRGERTI